MTTTLKNWARGLNFNSSRAVYNKLLGFKSQVSISRRSRVIVYTDRQTDRQTDRYSYRQTSFTIADPLALLIAQPTRIRSKFIFVKQFGLETQVAIAWLRHKKKITQSGDRSCFTKQWVREDYVTTKLKYTPTIPGIVLSFPQKPRHIPVFAPISHC